MSERLKITEIFLSLQGEARNIGWPTVFVRLTGCPLRCQYCDTEYAFYGGEWRSLDEILAQVGDYKVKHVCVTGGEPLAQKTCRALLSKLCEQGYEVSLETSGAMDVGNIDPRVQRVVDIKTPDSAEEKRNRLENLSLLTSHDQAKFVICSRRDYEWARGFIAEHALEQNCEVLFSPSHGQVEPRELADWIVQDRLPVRFQWQLHKQLWGDQPGR